MSYQITRRLDQFLNPLYKDTAAIDGFGRERVSTPETIFDSKNIYYNGYGLDAENQPLFYDNQQTSGSGTSTSYRVEDACQTLEVSGSIAGTRVRQSKMRFNYQPGKSQQILRTFNLRGSNLGITKRIGYFDENNGIFLELKDGEVFAVLRAKTTGSVVETKIKQSDWNVDPLNGTGDSGITIDFTKTQILYIDFEWLGVGRVRLGFVIGGVVYYAHYFNNSNVLTEVYMSTPNLPLRDEIINDGTGLADTMDIICSSVASEGGTKDLGIIKYISTEGINLLATTTNTVYAMLGIRLKPTHIGISVKPLEVFVSLHSASHRIEWFLLMNPTVAGTFTYADVPYSAIQAAKGVTANTVTGGTIKIAGGFVDSSGTSAGGAGGVGVGIGTSLLIGSNIDNSVDTLVLCVRPVDSSTSVEVEGAITWRELI